jgi:hypothetical protein
VYDFKWIKMMKSWMKFLGEKTQIKSSCQRVVGYIFPNENVAICDALLLHSLQGPRVVWDVLFDFEQE